MTSLRGTPYPNEPLKVASTTDPGKLAGMILGVIREHGQAELQMVGDNTLGIAMKAARYATNMEPEMDLVVKCHEGGHKVLCQDGVERAVVCIVVAPR